MSFAAMGYAFGLALHFNDKWVLVCLADYADDWGDSIFPALDTLADKAGASEDTIKRALQRLITAGLVERVAESTPVSPAFYRILGVPEPKKFEKEPTCPAVLRRAVIHVFEARCEFCSRQGSKDLGPDDKPWTIDRIVPGKRGGVYMPDNVTLACRFCNTKRRSNPVPDGTRTLSDLQRGEGANCPLPKTRRGTQAAPQGGRSLPLSEGGQLHPDPLLDPVLDPSSERAVAAPRPRAATPERTPEQSLAVITRLAHETFDALGLRADAGDLTETLKSRCARLRIPYNSAVVLKALDSARWQREHPPSQEVH